MSGTEAQAIFDAVRQIAPKIRAYAPEIDAHRELPRSLFEALADIGVFHMLTPRSLGGPEIPWPWHVRIIEELAKADGSTGWVVNQNSVHATYAARMPREDARAIWIDTPRAVVSNTPAAIAEALVVPGGYRVTGPRMDFSTGCRHASWLAAHAQVMENGQPRKLPDGRPDTRYMFVPVNEAERLDTWNVRGLRGTSTHAFAVHDVFVPESRTVLAAAAPLYESGPLYQIPRTLLFAAGDAAVALGTARTSLTAFAELAGVKEPRASQGLLRTQPMVQADIGYAEAKLRAARAFLMEAVQDLWDTVSANQTPTLEQRVTMRLATTHGIRQAGEVVDIVYNASGTTAIYDGHIIQRAFQDVHVMSQHVQGRRAHYELVGRHWLGLEIDESRL